jgi:hypothetical protein
VIALGKHNVGPVVFAVLVVWVLATAHKRLVKALAV